MFVFFIFLYSNLKNVLVPKKIPPSKPYKICRPGKLPLLALTWLLYYVLKERIEILYKKYRTNS